MKRFLSIVLSVCILLGTVTVLTMLPAMADSTGPVNLITNGDMSMGTWGDLGYTTAEYGTDDWGFIVENNAYGWRSAGRKDTMVPYANASLYWQNTGISAAQYPESAASAPSVQINKWNQTMQDFKIEAGKDYTVSVDAKFVPVANSADYTAWFDIAVANKAGVFIDAVDNTWASVTGVSYDLCDSGDSIYNTLYVDTSVENYPTFTYNDVVYWDFGDFKTYSFTFSADEVIADYGLTDSDADGYYDVTLGIQNSSGLVLVADNISVYEVLTITADEGGYITGNADASTGEDYTVTAVPYYGNTFAGWYCGDELVSSSATISGTLNKSLVAKFNVYNQIVDGSFEANNGAGADFFNKVTSAANGGKNTVAAVPSGSSAAHGDYALYAAPATAINTNCDLINIPVTVKKNTRYVFHLSYYMVDTAYAGYVGLHADKSFTNGWTKSTFVPSYTYHWEVEGATNLNAWTVCGGVDGSYGMMRDQTHATVGSGANKWIDYWLTFETGEETSIFEDGADTATMRILFGVGNSVTNTYYIDNVSFTEAKTTANSAISAVSAGNGSVSVAQYVPDSVCYADTGGAKVGSAATAVEGSVRYSQVAIKTYTATPDTGYEFAGWYDAGNNLVSMNATETFVTEGVYTAKFATAPYAKDGGFITKNDDGTYTAKAYYGNAFKGWFDIDGELITTDATIEKQVGMYADFEKHNLIDGGDFEDGVVNYYIQNTNSSASVKTDKDGNKFLRMESTTTGNALYSFQWNFTLEKNKKYIISYRLRSGIDEEGNLISTQGSSFRRMFLYHTGNHSYTWSDPVFAEQLSVTNGSKSSYTAVPDLLPSGGSDLNPSGSSTSFPGTFTYTSDEWTYYSLVLDTSSVTLANGTDITDNIDLGMLFGANGACTMALDIDDIVVSEVNNQVEFSSGDGGTAMVDRIASTATLPVTFTATPSDENYVFIGWVDQNGDAVSANNPYSTFEAEKLTASFAYYDPEGTTFQVNAKVEKQDGIYGGYLTGDTSVTGVIGSTATFTAVPYIGNTFDGWYVNGQKVSSSEQYTFYISGAADVVAKFNINNLWSDSGYENTARDTTILSDKALQNGSDAYFEWHSYVPSLWWDAKVLTSKPYSGETSLELTHRNNEVLREVTGLQKNTDYEFSFYWFIRNSLSGSSPSYLKQIRFYDKNGKMFSYTTLNTEYSADFQNTKVYFNSGDNTEIYVAITYYAGSSSIVCDDFCLIPGTSDDYVTVSYDSGDERVGVITELAPKGEYTVKAPSWNPPAKDFVNWSMGGTEYAKGATLTLDSDITLTANYTDFVSDKLTADTTFDPANYDFTFAVLPDQQKLLLQYPDYYVDITNWIVANQDEYNIAGVLNMGDITEHGSYEQWYATRQAFDAIIGKIPFAISLGNHDYSSSGGNASYNSKIDRLTHIFNRFYKQEDFNTVPEWGGAYDDSMDNTYHKFDIDGVKIMVISLEIYPRYDVIEWAAGLCEANPDYKVIVTTHAHLEADGTRKTEAESPYGFTNPDDSSSPQELYDRLLKVYPNIMMLLCGHESNSQTLVNTSTGDNGNTIYEILMDNQNDDINYRGVGNVVLMGFYDDATMVDFTTYSTVQDKYFFADSNEFTLALDKTIDVEGGGDASYDKEYVGETLITTYTAAPYYGNTFAGWYDIDGNLVSKNLTYSTATYSYLKAVFYGPNTIQGGDFEGDTIPDIIFSDTNRFSLADFGSAVAGHGDRYLAYNTTAQETLQSGFRLPVEKNTDYTLSFDIRVTDFGVNGGLRMGFLYDHNAWDALAVIGGGTQTYKNPTTGYVKSYSSAAGETHRPGTNLGYTEYTDKFGSDWLRFSVTFNSGSDENVFGAGESGELYFMIHTLNNGFSMQIDNLIFAAETAVTAQAEEGGTASADKTTAVIGHEITFTATPDYGNRFAGWYTLSGGVVSYSNVFTTTEHLNLVAKFRVFNNTSGGGFEDGTTGDWYTLNSGVTFEIADHDSSADADFGSKYLKVTDNATGYLNFGLPIDAQPATRYLVHFAYKVTSTTNSRIDIALSPKGGWGAFTDSTTYFSTAQAGATDTGMYDNKYPTTIANTFGDGFIDVNIIVDTAEELADGETMYLLLGAKADGVFCIDNVSVTAISDIAPSVLGATLIGETGKYKEGSISYKSNFGFVPTFAKLTEVGTIAMPTQLFSGELTLDTADVSFARMTDTSGINLNAESYYATFANTEGINPSAKISARSYVVLTDRYGKHSWTFYSENENAATAITGGVYNRSVNQVKRLLALALIERFAGNYPADFFSDDDVTETTNVKSSASVSVDKVWNFVKRNAYLLSSTDVYAPETANLINDGSFENDEFYLGAQTTLSVTDNPYSYTTYAESNGIAYTYDHDGFIYYSSTTGYYYSDTASFSDFISVDTAVANTGDRSLRLSTRAGTVSYILDDLLPNTDYEFSYYWYSTSPVFLSRSYIYPHTYMNVGYNYVEDVEIDGVTYRKYTYADADYLSPRQVAIEANALDYIMGPVYADGSWKKQTLKFNSGDSTSVVFGISYGSRVNSGTIWLDDMCLTQTDVPALGVENGDFAEGRNGWEGNASTYAIDGDSSATFTARGQYLKQCIGVERYTDYTLTVKARTSQADALYFGITDSGTTTLNPTTALSANSAMITDETGTVTYTVGFNSGVNTTLNVFLQSVCDSKINIFSVDVSQTDKLITYDTVDFEDSMTIVNGGISPSYAIAKTNNLWYYIDSNIKHSGDHSLRMAATSTDTNAASDVVTDNGDTLKHPLYQSWAEFKVNPGDWYTVSYYVKASNAGVSYESSVRTLDGDDWDYMQALDKKTVTLSDTEWTLIEHTFANGCTTGGDCYVNLVFSANDGTTADIYFDDITLARTNAVAQNDVTAPYTESLYNLVTDGSFEKGSSLYSAGSTVTAADAYDGDKYLRVTAGNKLIVPVNTRVDYNFDSSLYYTLSAAVRAGSGGAGYVGISTSADGETPVLNADGSVASISAGGTDWSFGAFRYLSPDVRPTYLVIECTAGYIDVDAISFFSDLHAFAEKPAESTASGYDYDDMTNAVTGGGSAVAGAVALSVNNTASGIADDSFSGVSATVYFPIIEDVMGRDMTEEQLDMELTRMKNAGIKRVRTMFKSQWAYTGDENDPWDWNSSQMQAFYAWCDKLAEYDIEVMLLAGWHLSSFVYGSSSISEVGYLSPRLLDQNGDVQYAVSWGIFHPVIDFDLAAERYAVWITEAVKAIRDHGVTNMTHVLTFNEPSHQNGSLYQGAHAAQMLQLVDTLVDRMNSTYTDSTNTQTVRDSVILVGPNQSGPSDVAGLAEYFAENSKYGYDLYDVWTTHIIESTVDRSGEYEKAPTIGVEGDVYTEAYQRYSSWLSGLEEIDSQFADVTFWCDEFASSGYSFQREGYTDEEQRWWAVKHAGQYAALMNAGLSGGILWQYADCLWSYLAGSGGEFRYGIHMGGATTSTLWTQTPYYIYYSVSMLTKYLSAGGDDATTYASTSANENVHISTVKFSDGNWSVLVVNNNETAQNISVDFSSSLGGKTLYRHVYEAATVTPDSSGALIDADKTYSGVTYELNDTIPAGSVVVYTSIKG